MKVGEHQLNDPQASPSIQKAIFGSLNGKKITENCCKYCENITITTAAVFGTTIASVVSYEMLLDLQTPLQVILFIPFSLSAIALTGTFFGLGGALLFNPIHF